MAADPGAGAAPFAFGGAPDEILRVFAAHPDGFAVFGEAEFVAGFEGFRRSQAGGRGNRLESGKGQLSMEEGAGG